MDAPATLRIDATPVATAVGTVLPLLADGGLVALPTETVYGLAARADRPAAVARLYQAKGRPAENPLIVHVGSVERAHALAVFGPAADALARAFWPGPLTLVLPLREGAPVAANALAGGATVAVRFPAAPVLAALARQVGPLVAPSANRSGRVSATTADAVLQQLAGRIDAVVDGGPSPIGIESTVVDLAGPPRLLRPGAIPAADLEALVGPLAAGAADGPLRSPGLLASHYAPRARLRLHVPAADVRPDEAWLALGAEPSAAPPERTFRLSPSGDLAEAARRLYAGLTALDATGAAVIAVSPIPAEGLGAALRDRLARAAAPRPAETP